MNTPKFKFKYVFKQALINMRCSCEDEEWIIIKEAATCY